MLMPNTQTEYRPDMPEAEYHDHPALGSTEIRKACTSIAELRHYQREGVDQTAAMRLGSAVHCAVLEPERFEAEYLDAPEPPVDVGDMYYRKVTTAEMMADGHGAPAISEEVGVKTGTVEGYMDEDDVWALRDFLMEYPDYDPDAGMSDDDLDTVRRMRDAVLEHPTIKGGLLDGGVTESSIFWQQPVGGDTVDGKGRLDHCVVSGGQARLLDLKTTSRSAKPGSYARVIGRRNYHVQAGWYTLGAEAALDIESVGHFLFLVVESDPPHHVQPLFLNGETLEAGIRRAREACQKIVEARRNPDTYTKLEPKIREVALKPWEL